MACGEPNSWPSDLLERSYEIADLSEKGLSRDYLDDFLSPMEFDPASGLSEYYVSRSEDKTHFTLTEDRLARSFLMRAHVRRDLGIIEVYQYPIGHAASSGPCIVLASVDGNKSWIACISYCECCRYRRRINSCDARGGCQSVAAVFNSKVKVGSNLLADIQVMLPKLSSDGVRVKACTVSDPDLALISPVSTPTSTSS